jgi:hypothetical protein
MILLGEASKAPDLQLNHGSVANGKCLVYAKSSMPVYAESRLRGGVSKHCNDNDRGAGRLPFALVSEITDKSRRMRLRGCQYTIF